LIYYHCFPGICLIEWPDRLDSSVLSRARRIISVNMEIRDDQSRVIRVETK
jgi:tRNA A37 threonylcarbamoyladenosine biosynthesis protein TsaE